MRNRICGASGAIFVCWFCAAHSAACGPGTVTGLFRGTGKPPGGATIEVTLNLLCANDAYSAQLFTSMGDFEVKEARSREVASTWILTAEPRWGRFT
jgi:hypothetical protein